MGISNKFKAADPSKAPIPRMEQPERPHLRVAEENRGTQSEEPGMRKNRFAGTLRNFGIVVATSLLITIPAISFTQTTANTASDTVERKQIIFEFSKETTDIRYEIKAVVQEKSIGTTYLLNGLTDEGWWYQSGLLYQDGKFFFFYEVFNDKGQSVYPDFGDSKPGGGAVSFAVAVNPGDTIILQESIGAIVTVSANDLETGASASKTLPAYGKVFVGDNSLGNWFEELFTGNKHANGNGCFSGLMTEILSYIGEVQNEDIAVQHYINSGNESEPGWTDFDVIRYSDAWAFTGTTMYAMDPNDPKDFTVGSTGTCLLYTSDAADE